MNKIPLITSTATAAIVLLGALLWWHAHAAESTRALADLPQPVSVVVARADSFRATRSYVGTLEPWVAASVGPQFVAAYVDTVLVRPGDTVKRHQVIATLDCRNANSQSQTIAARARAIEARQHALSDESARMQSLLQGNFVSQNEAEQKQAQSAAEAAELVATQATLSKSSLEVNDCILRAPFDGEVSRRNADPGAFVRPGQAVAEVVDRSTVRFSADAPEIDFAVVAQGVRVRLHALATNKDFQGVVARRAPAADADTRTVHFEVDLVDADRALPVGTTAEALIEVGAPAAALRVPIVAASINGDKATVFVVVNGVAHSQVLPVLGEQGGDVFFDAPSLKPGSQLVSEGRALLHDGAKVDAKLEQPASAPSPP